MTSQPDHPLEAPAEMLAPAKEPVLRRTLGGTVIASAAIFLFALVFIGPFAWILRDGLGPASVDRKGVEAMARTFWTFYWGPVTLTAILISTVAALMRRVIKKRTA